MGNNKMIGKNYKKNYKMLKCKKKIYNLKTQKKGKQWVIFLGGGGVGVGRVFQWVGGGSRYREMGRGEG